MTFATMSSMSTKVLIVNGPQVDTSYLHGGPYVESRSTKMCTGQSCPTVFTATWRALFLNSKQTWYRKRQSFREQGSAEQAQGNRSGGSISQRPAGFRPFATISRAMAKATKAPVPRPTSARDSATSFLASRQSYDISPTVKGQLQSIVHASVRMI